MKKIVLPLLVLAAAAAAAFAKSSIKNQKLTSEKYRNGIDTYMFTEDELPLPAEKLALSDGNWVFRVINENYVEDLTEAVQMEISIKDGNYEDFSLYCVSTYYIYPQEINMSEAEKYGAIIDGREYSFYKKYTKEEFVQNQTTLEEKYKKKKNAKKNDQEYRILILQEEVLSALDEALKTVPEGCRTNSNSDGYMWIEKEGKKETFTFFLSKK